MFRFVKFLIDNSNSFFFWNFNPIPDGPFRGCSRMRGEKAPLHKIYHTYQTIIKIGTVTPYFMKV